MYEIKDKVFLITGAASGIGAGVVTSLLEEGAKNVVILDIMVAEGKELEKTLNSIYGKSKVKFYNCDVTKEDQVDDVFDKTIQEFGYIDTVINNAGIMNDSEASYRKEIEINVLALISISLKAYKLMRLDQGGRGGTIVNIASIVALNQLIPLPVYSATKGAVLQFSLCLGHISILDFNSEKGKLLEAELNDKHGENKVKFYKCDVTIDENVNEVFTDVLDNHGYIDFVLNGAGTGDEYNHIKLFQVNMGAVLNISIKAFKVMTKARGGHGGTIINFSSLAGLVLFPSLPVYCATKLGILQFGMNLGCKQTFDVTGVRVITVCFGKTQTGLIDNVTCIDEVPFMQQMVDSGKSLITQKVENAAYAVLEAYVKGSSDSIWLAADDKPVFDYTSHAKKAFNVLSDMSEFL